MTEYAQDDVGERHCQTCRGTGEHLYGNTAMGMGGPGGQAFTVGPCPGTRHRPDLTDCPVVLAMIAERGVWEPNDVQALDRGQRGAQ